MDYTIRNSEVTVVISSRGAELMSIKGKDGTEYLWQGDPAYWSDRALNLFPYIARMTEGRYTLEGTEYQMPIHGFVNSSELRVEEATESSIVFRLDAGEATLKQYPYDFTYRICYSLEGKKLSVTLLIDNHTDRVMYFGAGGHPGFMVPLEKDLAFEDYYLEFAEAADAYRVGISPTCFVTGEDIPYRMKEGRIIPMSHDLFDQDAIVLKGMARSVTLKTDRGNHNVTVNYPDMSYLGIWQMPHTDAPYVCLEPWTSLPSRQDIVEELSTQPGLIHLKANGSYRNEWDIVIG